VNFAPYKVDFGDAVYSDTYNFKSLAAANLPVSCVIFNDLHNKFPVFESMCNALGDRDYQFSIFNGDCLSNPQFKDKVVETLAVYNKGVKAHSRPALYIRGNHEIRGSLARDFKNMFDYPDNEFFFAMTAGPIRFIFLDCGEDKEDDHEEYSGLNDFTGYREKQKEWLKKETKSAAFLNAKYRILIHHIPLYNHNNTGVSDSSRTSWSSVLDSVPIDVAISGHTHQYNFVPIKAAGNNYPVLIGGGLEVETATVMVLSATEKQLSIDVLNAKGEIVGKFEKPASDAD
jgi:Icc-related predicted phosphoesterase